MSETSVIAETKFLELVQRDGWVFAKRPDSVGCVAIIAITNESEVILVEQFRLPTHSRVIELPAGLVGDTEGTESEAALTAAKRELFEETGYRAQTWKPLPSVVSSAGLTNEKVNLFLARRLEKLGEGGGVDNEEITVHKIPVSELATWLDKSIVSGKDVDSRVYSVFHFATLK